MLRLASPWGSRQLHATQSQPGSNCLGRGCSGRGAGSQVGRPCGAGWPVKPVPQGISCGAVWTLAQALLLTNQGMLQLRGGSSAPAAPSYSLPAWPSGETELWAGGGKAAPGPCSPTVVPHAACQD